MIPHPLWCHCNAKLELSETLELLLESYRVSIVRILQKYKHVIQSSIFLTISRTIETGEAIKTGSCQNICAGNSPVPGQFPAQRPVTRSFDVFFGLRLNKWLSKQSWGWWFEMLSCPLWHHCNGTTVGIHVYSYGQSTIKYMKWLTVNDNRMTVNTMVSQYIIVQYDTILNTIWKEES